jgi:hypothetical protein
MLKGEREFRRNWRPWDERKANFDKDYRVMRRAVVEECAEVAESFHEPPYPRATSSMYTVPQKIAAAIRKGGKG